MENETMIDFSAVEAAAEKWGIATKEVNAAILPIITQICSSKDLNLLAELKSRIPSNFPRFGIMVAELLLSDEQSANTHIN